MPYGNTQRSWSELALLSPQKGHKEFSPDFFYRYDEIFRSCGSDALKKILFGPERHKRTFSTVTMKFGTFSTDTMKFSTAGIGIFGEFVLILFYSYEKNPTVIGISIVTSEKVIFHCNLGKSPKGRVTGRISSLESSIVTAEKIRGQYQGFS